MSSALTLPAFTAATAFDSMALASAAPCCCANAADESARAVEHAAAVMNERIIDLLPVSTCPDERAGSSADRMDAAPRLELTHPPHVRSLANGPARFLPAAGPTSCSLTCLFGAPVDRLYSRAIRRG